MILEATRIDCAEVQSLNLEVNDACVFDGQVKFLVRMQVKALAKSPENCLLQVLVRQVNFLVDNTAYHFERLALLLVKRP